MLPDDAELFLLMGADSLLNLRKWHRAEDIPFAAEMIVASRPGQPLEDIATALPDELALEPVEEMGIDDVELRVYSIRDGAGRCSRFYLLPGLHVDISASAIRAQVNTALSSVAADSGLLPIAVAEYIRKHRLYR